MGVIMEGFITAVVITAVIFGVVRLNIYCVEKILEMKENEEI